MLFAGFTWFGEKRWRVVPPVCLIFEGISHLVWGEGMKIKPSFSRVLRQSMEAIALNVLYLYGRWRMARSDQARRIDIRRNRPDIHKRDVRGYPFRDRLPPRLHSLYRQVIRETKQILGRYHNPFVLPPSVFFGYEPEGPGHYSAERHEILLSHEFGCWYRWVSVFFLTMQSAIKEARRDPKLMPWKKIGQRMQERGALYEDLLGAIEQRFFTELLPVWKAFVEQLAPFMEECEHTEQISEGLLDWYESLEQLHAMLECHFRWVIIHEYIHSQTRWIIQRFGKEHLRLIGVMRMQTDIPFSTTLPLQHRLLNEALTEWMALRFYDQITGKNLQIRWGELAWGSAYPAWIIEYVAQALDSQWEPLSQAFPPLRRAGLAGTAEFLFHLFFVDPEMTHLLKDLLAYVGQQPDAFEKVSDACERCYHVSDEQGITQQQTAIQDLYDLFSWTFPENIRQMLAFVASADAEKLLRFAQAEGSAHPAEADEK